jgi:hypothetical protein
MNEQNHYRVTLPELYDKPTCSGHDNPSGRQGHYVDADSPGEAVEKIIHRFATDDFRKYKTQFDVELFRPERLPAVRIVAVRVTDERALTKKGEELEVLKSKWEDVIDKIDVMTDKRLESLNLDFVDELEELSDYMRTNR